MYIRQAVLDVADGEIIPMIDASQTAYSMYAPDELGLLQEITIHYKKGMLRSIALHEASHAIAAINVQLPSFVSTLTIARSSFIINSPSYAHSRISYTDQQRLKRIIINLAGTVGEQIFDTYRYQGYSSAMITDKDEIYTFLSSRIGVKGDMEDAMHTARQIAYNQGFTQEDLEDKVKEIIADCYVQTYKLISKNKLVIEKLADAAMQKGTLHEDEIYEIADVARPLHSFEHGAMTESESAMLGQYRFPDQLQTMKN